MRSAADLKVGEKGVVREFTGDDIPMKLLEMGCLPGVEMELKFIAPLRDPLYIRVADYHLAIRKETAAQILLEVG
ncbi:MAG: ferrous iron transport protein A [Bacteroidota bacterium]|nr:ferrous iron transport protein A [Bacteroidota bacterium]